MEEVKKSDRAYIFNLPEEADAVALLRAIIKQKRDEAGKTSQQIDDMEEAAVQARCVLEAQYTYIDDLERDADRLDAMNNGGDVRRPTQEKAS